MKEFEVGDRVIIFKNDSSAKLGSKWTGPALILERKSKHSYLVQMPNGGRRVWHE